MNDTYVEWMVKRKTSVAMKFLKMLLIILTVMIGLLAMVAFNMVLFIVAIVIGVGAYFASMNSDVEYEYLYVDKELTVDKVLAKSRRKKVATFDLGKMEVMAPIKSYHLDNYKNRQDKAVDYSSGEEQQPDHRYVFYYDGKQKVIFEPNQEMVKAIQFIAPRKVFMD